MKLINRIEDLSARGFAKRDIRRLTGATNDKIDELLGTMRECDTARSVAERLLARVPWWWEGTAEAYRDCVWNNFYDVLTAA